MSEAPRGYNGFAEFDKQSPAVKALTISFIDGIDAMTIRAARAYPDLANNTTEFYGALISALTDQFINICAMTKEPEKSLKDLASTLTSLHVVHETLQRKKGIF